MLEELRITNFALIDEVLMEFGAGLNVFTGETGAGKSILLQALGLLLGGRADTSAIRAGADELRVEGRFRLEDEDSELVLARVVSREGKSKCYANGSLVTVTALAESSYRLVDLHGQHDHQALLHPACHVDYLDRFCGVKQMRARERWSAALDELRDLQRQIAELGRFVEQKEQRKDLLGFQVDEINAAGLRVGEDEEIASGLEVLRNAERLASAASGAKYLLASDDEGAALETARRALAELGAVGRIDARLDETAARLESCSYELEEIAHELRDYAESAQFDPQELAQAEERMALIGDLKRKYGGSIEAVLGYEEQASGELAKLDIASDEIGDLEARRDRLDDELRALADGLHEARAKAASAFSRHVAAELGELNMAKAKLDVQIDRQTGADAEAFGPAGADEVEFRFSPNVGEPARALAKIASGGEMSRVMLATKIVLGAADDVSTLVFDEIDSGIGGKAAAAVGAKLSQLAGEHQVICVTHLPQIASCAHRHFSVGKTEAAGRTVTSVAPLDKEARVDEIARMLSGTTVSEASLRHAKEMLCGS